MNYFLTKCYHGKKNAGSKAKQDIEQILQGLGFRPIGIRRRQQQGAAAAFVWNLLGLCSLLFRIKRHDKVVIQYPYKKFYRPACTLVHCKGGEVVTLIHDLGACRRKRISVAHEVRALNRSDSLVVHNEAMRSWLEKNGLRRPMKCLELFDYLSESNCKADRPWEAEGCRVMYAGALSPQKNRYLYELAGRAEGWRLDLYGNGFEAQQVSGSANFTYHGYVSDETLIATSTAHWGLLWEGDSLTTCQGDFGEYLRLNNPHKCSLYIRCGLPVIIWKEAALAPFVQREQIGIAVSSLEELNTILPSITPRQYQALCSHVRRIDARLKTGYYTGNVMK